MYDAEIKLIKELADIENIADDYGDVVKTYPSRTVFAEMKSIGMKEFYQANASGFKPEIVFELCDYMDYENEPLIEYEGGLYTVIRTYRKHRNIEIVCSKGVNNAST